MSDPNIDGQDEQPTSLSGKIRQFQDSQLNDGWRIQMIPHGDPTSPMVEFNAISLVGALGFLAGAAMIWKQERNINLAIGLITSGLALAFFGVWFKAKRKRRNWEVTQARCVDREVQKGAISTKHGVRWRWFWRVVCEFEYHGTQYRVTPEVHWNGLPSNIAAWIYFERHVSSNGECLIRFNPKNPLQAEFTNQDIKELILYNRLIGILITTATVAILIFGISKCLPKQKATNKAASGPQPMFAGDPQIMFVGGPTSMKVTTNMVLRIESTNGEMALLRFVSFGEDTASYRWLARLSPSSGSGTVREAYDHTNHLDGKAFVIPKPGNDVTVRAGNIYLGCGPAAEKCMAGFITQPTALKSVLWMRTLSRHYVNFPMLRIP